MRMRPTEVRPAESGTQLAFHALVIGFILPGQGAFLGLAQDSPRYLDNLRRLLAQVVMYFLGQLPGLGKPAAAVVVCLLQLLHALVDLMMLSQGVPGGIEPHVIHENGSVEETLFGRRVGCQFNFELLEELLATPAVGA